MPNIPKIGGKNHEFICILDDKVITNGDSVLPIWPITLVHPKPKLLTSVGYSYAIYT